MTGGIYIRSFRIIPFASISPDLFDPVMTHSLCLKGTEITLGASMMVGFDAGAITTANAGGTCDCIQSWESEHHKLTDDAESVVECCRAVEIQRRSSGPSVDRHVWHPASKNLEQYR